MPQKVWTVGEEVLAADFNTYVQQQIVAVFATVAARDSGWTAPPNGAMCVTTDTNTTWLRKAGVWQPPPGTVVWSEGAAFTDILASSVGIRDIVTATGPGTKPYPMTILAVSGLYGGFGAVQINQAADVQLIYNGAIVNLAPNPVASIAAAWMPLGGPVILQIPANQVATFKWRHNTVAMASGQCHTAGTWTAQWIAQ